MKSKAPNPLFSKVDLSRREFVKRTCAVGLAAVSAPLLIDRWVQPANAAVAIENINATTVEPPQQPNSPGSFQPSLFQSPFAYGFSLGGAQPVEVFGFEGGEPIGRPSKGMAGTDGRMAKRIEAIQYRDLVFYYLPVHDAPVNAWLTNSLKGTNQAVSGSIIVKERLSGQGSEVQFSGGFLRQIVFSEVDVGSAQQPASMRITMGIQESEYHSNILSPQKFLQKAFASAPMKGFFDLSFQNMGVVSNVVRVESPTFTAKLLPAPNGSGLQGAFPIDYSNLSFQLPENLASSFYAWHSDFVLKGKNGDKFETRGMLRWLSPTDTNTVMFSLALDQVGILSVVRLPMKPGYVQVEMYCERVVPMFA
ncbi:MAG: twin-arginine translocation signal domain-containing protein [Nitrospirota bacterium]